MNYFRRLPVVSQQNLEHKKEPVAGPGLADGALGDLAVEGVGGRHRVREADPCLRTRVHAIGPRLVAERVGG